jgi:5-methylcytosine-specific restriction endonuclease McrA
MKHCKKCNQLIKNYAKIDGKLINISKRKYCLDCSPYKAGLRLDFYSGKKRVNINDLSNEDFISLIKSSTSRKEMVQKLGYTINGPSYVTLNRRIKKLGLDTSHFKLKQTQNALKKITIPLTEILENKVIYNDGPTLKRRLFKTGLLKNECSKCKNVGIWMGLPLTLQLDHKDGNNDNNCLDNLQILCPNCHTQTKNWGSKNRKRPVRLLARSSDSQLLEEGSKPSRAAIYE